MGRREKNINTKVRHHESSTTQTADSGGAVISDDLAFEFIPMYPSSYHQLIQPFVASYTIYSYNSLFGH